MFYFSKHKKILLLVAIIFLIIGSILYRQEVFPTIKNAREEQIVVPVLAEGIYTGEVSTTPPTSISIPSVGISGLVIPVGITENGNMAVPKRFEDVGWYKFGATPGQIGTSVLAGHVDNGKGKAGVFYNLSDLKIGDYVFVENEKGERLQFLVREIKLVDYENPPLQEIFGQGDKERLNLITCDGTWIPEKKTYSERLVVFTERIK